MTVHIQRLTNGAYGFPKGAQRRVTPVALVCVHITGNSRTAAYDDPQAGAWAEWQYANRAGSDGPSAHVYWARDGFGIDAIHNRFAAWSNGDVKDPNTANPGIRRVLALRSRGYNANEAYWEEWENVGHPSGYRITNAQVQAMGERLRALAAAKGLPIDRETVHGHWEINGVDRRLCPDGDHEDFLNRIIAAANGDDVTPAPITDETPKLVRALEGHTRRDLDGTTVLVADAPALDWRLSPYGVTVPGQPMLRAIYGTVNGLRRIVLVAVSPENVKDLPEPEPTQPASVTYPVSVGGKPAGSVTLP